MGPHRAVGTVTRVTVPDPGKHDSRSARRRVQEVWRVLLDCAGWEPVAVIAAS
jgi:hypothetical protein